MRNIIRPAGSYSDHDDAFAVAAAFLRDYLRAVDRDSALVEEDRDSAIAHLVDLVDRDEAEGASADDAYAALQARGLRVPAELRDAVNAAR